MKRYIQVLIMVMCVVAFGAKTRAQEASAKTNYHGLVYWNIYAAHNNMHTLKTMIEDYISEELAKWKIVNVKKSENQFIRPTDDERHLSLQLGIRCREILSVTQTLTIVIGKAVEDGVISLSKDDSQAVKYFNATTDNAIRDLDIVIKSINTMETLPIIDILTFKRILKDVRSSKRQLEEIIERGNWIYGIREEIREK